MAEDEILAQLREIFRGELADQVRLLQRQRAILLRAQSSEQERQEAIFEIYRAVHSLKGAARSVGEHEIVVLCHAFEEALGDARHGRPVELAVAKDVVDQALAQLERIVEPDEDAERAPVAAAPPERADETMRVSVARVARLMQSCNGLAGLLGAGGSQFDVEGPLAAIRQTLRDFKALGPAIPNLQESVNDALAACASLGRAWMLRQTREAIVQTNLRSKILDVSRQVRELRLLAAQDLVLSIEQAATEHAAQLGKVVLFESQGADTLLDRDILGRVRTPLIHLVHNAIDHGLEAAHERQALGKPTRGSLRFEVRTFGDEVRFALQDDGRGLDLAALEAQAVRLELVAPDVERSDRERAELAFLPGLSTRSVATETSGRGVGLDVVRRRVQELQGRVTLSTRPGEGTRIELWIPTQLNAITAITVVCDQIDYLIPVPAVERILRPKPEHVRRMEEGTWLALEGGEIVPLTRLSALLGGADSGSVGPCVVLEHAPRKIALWVDRVLDVRESLSHPLGPRAIGSAFVSSAAVSSEGVVLPVLDVEELVKHARPGVPLADEKCRQRRRVLVVDDSITTRQLVRTILEGAGHDVALAEDGEAAWRAIQTRGPFDLVVSDIEMPALNGLQLLARLRATRATTNVPVVLVTALESDHDRRRALELGADAYVVKSAFDQRTLLDTVEDLLA